MEFPRIDFNATRGLQPKPAPLPPAPAAEPAAPQGPAAKPTPAAHDLFGEHSPWDEAHVAKLDPHAQAVVAKLKETGDWHQGNPTLGEQVEGYLANGGSPKVAVAILDQIRHPRHIHQVGGKNTCAAAAAQELLATHAPSKYFQMASELSSTGHTRIDPGNHGFVVTDENRAFIAEQGYDPGAKISATMQAAMLEYANGFVKYGGDLYHMDKDVSDHDGDGKHQGVTIDQFNTLTGALVGAKVFSEQYESMQFDKGALHFGLGAVFDAAQRTAFVLGLGASVSDMMGKSPDGFLMTIHGEHRPHAVLVTGYNAETGEVRYHDPRNMDSSDEHCTLNELADRITQPKGHVGDGGTAGTTAGGVRGVRPAPPPPPAPTAT
ncbi:MAG: hypothetical protein JWM80_6072 [Cyanobacteria bacterium RYN_339]|nr:hypothetical protein [Cyanobacteria bacterium RYN_339]